MILLLFELRYYFNHHQLTSGNHKKLFYVITYREGRFVALCMWNWHTHRFIRSRCFFMWHSNSVADSIYLIEECTPNWILCNRHSTTCEIWCCKWCVIEETEYEVCRKDKKRCWQKCMHNISKIHDWWFILNILKTFIFENEKSCQHPTQYSTSVSA